FNRKHVLDPRAYACLEKQYTKEQINDARIRMAYIPENSELIENPIAHVPGFKVENVYVMAGVPRIMQAMFNTIKGSLKTGPIMHSTSVSTYLTEGTFATALEQIQNKYPDVEIGSYPFLAEGKYGTSLVTSSINLESLKKASNDI